MVAVEEAYTSQGIAYTMYRILINHARRLGFTHAVTEPTGNISQYILKDKFAFNELYRINYDEYEYQGERVFAGIEGHQCVSLMEKSLAEIDTTLLKLE
jgi:GNAT superfamily N-acetyltransferase